METLEVRCDINNSPKPQRNAHNLAPPDNSATYKVSML